MKNNYLSATNRKETISVNDFESLYFFLYYYIALLFRSNLKKRTCKNVLPSSRNSLKGGSVSERFLNSDHPARPNC